MRKWLHRLLSWLNDDTFIPAWVSAGYRPPDGPNVIRLRPRR